MTNVRIQNEYGYLGDIFMAPTLPMGHCVRFEEALGQACVGFKWGRRIKKAIDGFVLLVHKSYMVYWYVNMWKLNPL